MDRKRAQELLPIITAFAEGKTIQTRLNGDFSWCDCGEKIALAASFDFEYRIKPEAREFWLAPDSLSLSTDGFGNFRKNKPYGGNWIKVREVIE